MNMKPWAWLQSPACQNAWLTNYNFHSRMKKGYEILSMFTVRNMLVYNPPPMITRAGWKMTWNHQHDYGCQECTTYLLWLPEQNEEMTWNHQHMYLQSLICQNAQPTSYDCQNRMKKKHEVISMFTVTNMPECRPTNYDSQRINNEHTSIWWTNL